MKRILFIEDEREIHEVFSQELELNDINDDIIVDYCASLTQARKLIARGLSFDLIISDVYLEDFNLIDFLERVNIFHSSPLFLISAYMHRVEENEIIQNNYNIVGVYRKPFGLSQMVLDILDRLAVNQVS